MHPDERFFDRGLPPAISLDDFGLERKLAKPRHFKPHCPRLRLELALVVVGAIVEPLTSNARSGTLGIDDPLRQGFTPSGGHERFPYR